MGWGWGGKQEKILRNKYAVWWSPAEDTESPMDGHQND